MVSGIQLLGILFGLVQSYFTFLHFKRREFTIREFIGWEAVWVSFVVITLFPQPFATFAVGFGVIRPLDLFIILGFIVTLSISFYTYVNVDKLRKQFEKAVRDLALIESEVSQKKSK